MLLTKQRQQIENAFLLHPERNIDYLFILMRELNEAQDPRFPGLVIFCKLTLEKIINCIDEMDKYCKGFSANKSPEFLQDLKKQFVHDCKKIFQELAALWRSLLDLYFIHSQQIDAMPSLISSSSPRALRNLELQLSPFEQNFLRLEKIIITFVHFFLGSFRGYKRFDLVMDKIFHRHGVGSKGVLLAGQIAVVTTFPMEKFSQEQMILSQFVWSFWCLCAAPLAQEIIRFMATIGVARHLTHCRSDQHYMRKKRIVHTMLALDMQHSLTPLDFVNSGHTFAHPVVKKLDEERNFELESEAAGIPKLHLTRPGYTNRT